MPALLTKLPNGLRVVSETMPRIETVALGVWVGVGARHESLAQAGISHFLEHMAFKGTRSRSARAIAEEIESVGGELNAATGAETTAYYARILKGDEGTALGLIADILQNSLFAEDELARERDVILQEIASIHDSPDDIAYDLLHDAAYPGQGVGRPIIGTPATVSAIGAGELRTFLAERYHPGATVIAAAGAVDHAALVRHAVALFGGLTGGSLPKEERARYMGGVRASKKSFEQAHLLVGFESPRYADERFPATQVLSWLTGGGMSSRLFQEIRERRGLCYAIYSSAWGLKDTGMFAVHAATGDDMVEELIAVLGEETRRLADSGPTDAEVARAKAQLKAAALMSLEGAAARAEQLARQVLGHGRPIEYDELIGRVESVTAADVVTLFRDIVATPPSVALVGAGARSADLAAAAARTMAQG
jgi:predicted Zn-dependent peptidase